MIERGRLNLKRDGAAVVARHVRGMTRSTRGAHCLCVRRDGTPRVYPKPKLPVHEEPNLIGTYSKQTPAEVIAGDCDEWLFDEARTA